jgi:hypothetical protein
MVVSVTPAQEIRLAIAPQGMMGPILMVRFVLSALSTPTAHRPQMKRVTFVITECIVQPALKVLLIAILAITLFIHPQEDRLVLPFVLRDTHSRRVGRLAVLPQIALYVLLGMAARAIRDLADVQLAIRVNIS